MSKIILTGDRPTGKEEYNCKIQVNTMKYLL